MQIVLFLVTVLASSTMAGSSGKWGGLRDLKGYLIFGPKSGLSPVRSLKGDIYGPIVYGNKFAAMIVGNFPFVTSPENRAVQSKPELGYDDCSESIHRPASRNRFDPKPLYEPQPGRQASTGGIPFYGPLPGKSGRPEQRRFPVPESMKQVGFGPRSFSKPGSYGFKQMFRPSFPNQGFRGDPFATPAAMRGSKNIPILKPVTKGSRLGLLKPTGFPPRPFFRPALHGLRRVGLASIMRAHLMKLGRFGLMPLLGSPPMPHNSFRPLPFGPKLFGPVFRPNLLGHRSSTLNPWKF